LTPSDSEEQHDADCTSLGVAVTQESHRMPGEVLQLLCQP